MNWDWISFAIGFIAGGGIVIVALVAFLKRAAVQ